MFTSITIRDLNINQHNINKYAYIPIYLFKNKNIIFIFHKMHIINNLNIKIFIDIDIMKLKNIILNLQHDVIIINFY